MRAYRKLGEIPGPIDLAVIVVPRDGVLDVVDECGRKQVPGLVVITAGFREVGEDGARLELELQRRLRRDGMRMVGPNCMGVINTEDDIRLNATFAAAVPPRGNIGFISQSGALGRRSSRTRRTAVSAWPCSSRWATRRTSPGTTCSSTGRTIPMSRRS
jgi:acetyltransferase